MSTPHPTPPTTQKIVRCIGHYNNYFKTLVYSILCKSVFLGKPIVAPETMLGPFPPLETSFGVSKHFLRKKFHGVLLKLLSADTG